MSTQTLEGATNNSMMTITDHNNPVHETPIRPLFEGPIDIVGDVHGEFDGLRRLMINLGYDERGRHAEDRRLVFVGDLIDRGPRNPSVVRLVQGMVEAGHAQCILGNHELNLLRRQRKDGNAWFHGEYLDDGRPAFEEVLTSDDEREAMLDFFRGLPMALERDDLRVVHACWDDASIAQVRRPAKTIDLFHEHERAVGEQLKQEPVSKSEQQLAYQNSNPVKVLTSGFERKHPGFMHNGKMRYNERVQWWKTYATGQPFCVFGHYNRLNVPGNEAYIFDADDNPHAPLGHGNSTCIDLGGGWRPQERRAGMNHSFKSRLTALRWPDRMLIDDHGMDQLMRSAAEIAGGRL